LRDFVVWFGQRWPYGDTSTRALLDQGGKDLMRVLICVVLFLQSCALIPVAQPAATSTPPTATPRPPLPSLNPLLLAPGTPAVAPIPSNAALLYTPLYGPITLDGSPWNQRKSWAWAVPSVTANGRWMAAGGGVDPLTVEHLVTGQRWLVTQHPIAFAFLPDSSGLLYIVADPQRWQLRRFDLGSFAMEMLFESSTPAPTSFRISPDGEQIVYAAPGEPDPQLWLLDLARPLPRLAYTGFQPTWADYSGIGPLAWTTHGIIAYQLHATPPYYYVNTIEHALLLIDPATGSATQLADEALPFVAPDNTRVALYRYSDTMGGVPPSFALTMGDLTTGVVVDSFRTADIQDDSRLKLLQWAPDSRHLLYGMDSALILVRPDGSDQQIITFDWAKAPGELIDAVWIDATHILCITLAHESNTQHVFQLHVDRFALDQRETLSSVPALGETAAAWREQAVFIIKPNAPAAQP
jgi:hypothetical protein